MSSSIIKKRLIERGLVMTEGIRCKGGIAYVPSSGKYHAVISVWQNLEFEGEGEDFLHSAEFNSESEAMAFYKEKIAGIIPAFANLNGMNLVRKHINEIEFR